MSDAAFIPDDLAQELEAIAAEPRSFTDDGNAYRLVDHNEEDVRHLYGLGWLVWDGTRWAPDNAGEMTRRARDVVRRLHEQVDEAARLLLEKDPACDPKKHPAIKALRAHAKSSGSSRGVHAMLDLAGSDARIIIRDAGELDADPWLLNAPNGSLDLRTGKLRKHDRRDLCTRCVSVAYDPDAKAPTWVKFLERVTGGDRELVAYLQRLAGYALTGHTSEQVLALLIGNGLNGKSTFIEAFRGVLGDYAADTPAETLLGESHGGPQPELVRLRGARLVTAVETSATGRLNETLVKRLTGGDMIAARNLYSNQIVEFRPKFKLWLVSNNKPAIKEHSLAMWRRLRLVPFHETISPEERDADLARKLQAEAAGILTWSVAGTQEWRQHGLGFPKAVREATDEYRAGEDTIASFVDDCCVKGADLYITVEDLFSAWRGWCEANNETLGTKTAFGKALSHAQYEAARKYGKRVWIGLGLANGPLTRDTFNASSGELSTQARAGAHAFGNFPERSVNVSTRQMLDAKPLDPGSWEEQLELDGAAPTGYGNSGELDYGLPADPADEATSPALDLDPGEDVDPEEWAEHVNPHGGERPNNSAPTYLNDVDESWLEDGGAS